MSDFKFVPGYYEWHLYKGDKYLYVWDDFLENLPEEVNEEVACDYADMLMYQLMNDARDNKDKEYDSIRFFLDDEMAFVSATNAIADEIERRFA